MKSYDLSPDALPDPAQGAYPLVTQTRTGARVMVDESFLLPRLAEALGKLEAEGVAGTILLCAGTFANLHGTRPLYKPFEIGQGVLRALNLKTIGLITPVSGQEIPTQVRWEAGGWQTKVWTADLTRQDRAFRDQLFTQIQANVLECIVLDYVGHPTEIVQQLRETCPVPVIDLGSLAMTTLASTL